MSAASGPSTRQNAFAIVGLGRAHQGVDGLFRSLEGLLGVGHRRQRERERRRGQSLASDEMGLVKRD